MLHITPSSGERAPAVMSRRFSSKARKAAARSAPRPREPLHDGEPVGYFAEVTVRQCAIEAPQMKNGAQALPHNDGVTVRQCATEAPQIKNGAQALPHNDGVTVRQCATEAPQMKNGAQALPHNDEVTVRQCAIEAPQVKVGAQALDPSARKPVQQDRCAPHFYISCYLQHPDGCSLILNAAVWGRCGPAG